MNAPPVERAQPTPPPNDPTAGADTRGPDTPPTGTPERTTPGSPGGAGATRAARLLRSVKRAAPFVPAAFCACGHSLAAHPGGGRCAARLPDRCTCHGAREAGRSRDARTVATLAARVEREQAA